MGAHDRAVAEALREVTPEKAGALAVQDAFDEQAVVRGCRARPSFLGPA